MHTNKPYYGYIIVVLAFIIMAVQWSIIHSFGVFLKPLLAEFGWTRAATAGAFSLCSLLSGAIAIYVGWLNDRIGPRVVMSFCGVMLGVGCLLVSRTHSLIYFYFAFGVVIGLAMGGQFTPLMSTVARWFTARRGTMSGIVAAGVGVGALLGPQVASRLIQHWGWRGAYLIMGGAVLVITVACAQFLKAEPEHARVNQDDTPAPATPRGRAATTGMVHSRAVRSPVYWLFMFSGFCYGYDLFSLTVHVVAHAVDQGVVPSTAVGILSTFGGLSIVGKVFFGRVTDRIGSQRTMGVGFVMMALVYLGLLVAQGAGAIFLCAGLFGFFYGAITVSQSPMTAWLFGLKSHGLILGVFGCCVTVGGALGPYLTGYIFDRTGSYRIAFSACAAVAILGIITTAKIRSPAVGTPQPKSS